MRGLRQGTCPVSVIPSGVPVRPVTVRHQHLLLDDPDPDLGLHVGVQADRHAIDAERLDRLVQVDLALLDVEALRLELLRDVGRRDGAEQLAFFADARREGERDLLELLGEPCARAAALVLGRLEAIALLLDALQVARRRLVGEAAREQIVAGVARLDLHDVARLAEVLDRLAKDDFHGETPIDSGLRGRARAAAPVGPGVAKAEPERGDARAA